MHHLLLHMRCKLRHKKLATLTNYFKELQEVVVATIKCQNRRRLGAKVVKKLPVLTAPMN